MRNRLILILLVVPYFSFSQEIRGLLVNSFDQILGDSTQEAGLFEFIDECHINEVLFYSMYRIDFENPFRLAELKSVIRTLRQEHGVKNIGAAAEHFEFFEQVVHPYNADPLTDSLERINVYNLEFEFWSQNAINSYYCEHYLKPVGYPCTEEGAFIFVQKALEAMGRFKNDIPGIETELYIGWIEPDQAAQLSGMVDRILPAVYWYPESDGSLKFYEYSAQRNRLRDLAAGGPVNVLPIFNGASGVSDPSLYSWLQDEHSFCEPWDAYYTAFLAEQDSLILTNITIQGYVWFKYTALPDVPFNLTVPGPIIGPTEPYLNELVEFRIAPVKRAEYYIWKFIEMDTILRSTGETPSIHISFDNPGKEMMTVQAIGCGEKSTPYAFPLTIKQKSDGINPFPERNPVKLVIRVEQGILYCELSDVLGENARLEITTLLGQTIHSELLPAGKKVFANIPLPQEQSILLCRVISRELNLNRKVVVAR